MKTKCSIFFLILHGIAALAARGADFDLGTHGVLSVTLPEGWTANGLPAGKPGVAPIGYALAFKPADGANAKCLLTFAYITNRAPDNAVIRRDILRSSEPFVAESVEKKQNLKDFALEKGCGGYCVFTDASLVGKKATPGDYKVMGSGQLQPSEDMLGVVSLFADDADGKEFKAMLAIINSLKVNPKAATKAPSAQDTVTVTDLGTAFELGVPISRLTMTIPKGGLRRATNNLGGATGSARYYYFTDVTNGLIISGWFESQQRFPGLKKHWESETNGWTQRGMPSPVDVSFEKIDGWEVVQYDTRIPRGSNTHIRAHWLEAGTWIDIHLSMTSKRSIQESRESLVALFKGIEVKLKK